MHQIVKDIYTMMDNPPEITDEWAQKLGHNIAMTLKERFEEPQREHKLRLSSLGQGDRKLWYSVRKDTPKESLRPEVKLKFLFGDIIELIYLSFVELAGYEVTDEQKEVELEGIKGHIDCLIDGQLYDVKSASSFSFKKFKEGTLHNNDAFGYYAQLAAYSEAMGAPVAGWLVWDKQLGHMCFSRAQNAYLPDMRARAIHVKEMVEESNEPDRCDVPVPDGKSGNMKLPTMCSYCQFKKHCYRDINGGTGLRAFAYASGPKFLTHVANLPRVPEISIDDAIKGE